MRPSPTWTRNMVRYPRKLAKRWSNFFDEGWSLFNADGILQIQGLDDPEPGQPSLTDGEAYDLVSQRALEGSKMHALALYLDGKPSSAGGRAAEIWVPRALLE